MERLEKFLILAAILAAILLFGWQAAHAADLPCTKGPFSRLVHWRPPVADPNAPAPITSYRLYVGPQSAHYDKQVELGLPAPAADGSLAALVPNFSDVTNLFIAVSAIGPGGEGPLSNEIALGASAMLCLRPGQVLLIGADPAP